MHLTRQIPSAGRVALRLGGGFTLVELLVAIAVIGILASLLLPALSRARARASGVRCLSNTRQLTFAWLLYADDHGGRLPFNVGGAGTSRGVGARNDMNWASGILDWELTPDNTNSARLVRSGLGPYLARVEALFRCPSDRVVSSLQREAGWTGRVRSYSMNAMMGNAGDASRTGRNVNNPGYVQFFKLHQVPQPTRYFVMVDEHPDSINDGYFLNRADRVEWIDLPASYHAGAAAFSFADGHAELHRWNQPTTVQPARPDGAPLPIYLNGQELADWRWVMQRMSVSSAKPTYYGKPY